MISREEYEYFKQLKETNYEQFKKEVEEKEIDYITMGLAEAMEVNPNEVKVRFCDKNDY